MPTRLFLVRHGATELTAEDRFSGATDVPLSETGCKQVESLASRLASLRLFNDVSHYEGVPDRTFSQRLSRWRSPQR